MSYADMGYGSFHWDGGLRDGQLGRRRLCVVGRDGGGRTLVVGVPAGRQCGRAVGRRETPWCVAEPRMASGREANVLLSSGGSPLYGAYIVIPDVAVQRRAALRWLACQELIHLGLERRLTRAESQREWPANYEGCDDQQH